MAIFYDPPSLLNTGKFINFVLRNKGAPNFKKIFYKWVQNPKHTFLNKPIRDYIETIARIDEITKSQAFRDYKNQFKNVIKDERGAGMFVESWDRTRYLRFIEVLNQHLRGTHLGPILQKHLETEQAKAKNKAKPPQITAPQALPVQQAVEEKRLSKEEISQTLKDYQKTSGKEVKHVEKTHPPRSEEAVKKLDKLVGVRPEPPGKLVGPTGESLLFQPSTSTLPSPPPKSLVDLTGQPFAPQPPPVLVNPVGQPISREPLLPVPAPVKVGEPPLVPKEQARKEESKQTSPQPPKPTPPLVKFIKQLIPKAKDQPLKPPLPPAPSEEPIRQKPPQLPLSITKAGAEKPVMPPVPQIQIPKAAIPPAVKSFAVNNLAIPLRRFILRHTTPKVIARVVFGVIGGAVGATAGPTGIMVGAGVGVSAPTLLQPSVAGPVMRGVSSILRNPPRLGGGNMGRTASMAGRAVKMGRLAALLANPAGVVVVAILAVVILIPVLVLFQQLINTPNAMLPPWYSTGYAAPPGPQPTPGDDLDKRCNFSAFNIFEGGAIGDDLLQKYTDRALSTGKVKTGEQRTQLSSRARYIRDQAQSAGLNPAIFLGYWESESAFSDYSHPGVRPGMDLGCDPTNRSLTSFEENVLCAVGKSSISSSRTSQCAVSRDINSPGCKAIAFQQAEGVKLPIATLKDFLDSYGSKVADPNNINSDRIVKQNIVSLGLVQCTSPIPTTPPGGGTRDSIKTQFNIAFDSSPAFTNSVLAWAQEALERANTAPNFFPLLKAKGVINVTSTSGVGSTGGTNVIISTSAMASKDFFQQNLIHELAHVIHGSRADTTYSTQTAVSRDGGYLTGYAQGATSNPKVACESADSKDPLVQLDEDFAETVSYYINTNIPEQNYSKTNLCPPRLSINPLASGKYPEHIKYVKEILGGSNF